MPEVEHQAKLVAAGMPTPFAAMVAEWDAGVATGVLFDDGGQLGALIGRPTTSMAASVAVARAKMLGFGRCLCLRMSARQLGLALRHGPDCFVTTVPGQSRAAGLNSPGCLGRQQLHRVERCCNCYVGK